MTDFATTFAADTAAVADALTRALARALARAQDVDRAPAIGNPYPVTTVRLSSGAAVDLATDSPIGVAAWPHGPRTIDETTHVRTADQIPHAARVMTLLAGAHLGAARIEARTGPHHPRTTLTMTAAPERARNADADAELMTAALADRLGSRDHHPVTVLLSAGAAVDLVTLPNRGFTAERFVPGVVYLHVHGDPEPHVCAWAPVDGLDSLERAARLIVTAAHAAAA